MKNIIVVALLVFSSVAVAEIDPAMERDMKVAYFCSAMYFEYGSHGNYSTDLAQLGQNIRKATDQAAENAGIDWIDSMNLQNEAKVRAKGMADKLPVIPADLDMTCTYIANGFGLL